MARCLLHDPTRPPLAADVQMHLAPRQIQRMLRASSSRASAWAHVDITATTDAARTTRHVWLDHHPTAPGVLGCAGFDNTSDRFVTHDQRVLRRSIAVEGGQVAATDTCALNCDQNLTIRAARHRNVAYSDPTRTVENNRAHSGRARIKRRPDALRGAVGGAFH